MPEPSISVPFVLFNIKLFSIVELPAAVMPVEQPEMVFPKVSLSFPTSMPGSPIPAIVLLEIVDEGPIILTCAAIVLFEITSGPPRLSTAIPTLIVLNEITGEPTATPVSDIPQAMLLYEITGDPP